MVYLISLLEGIITFISPCLLPMLPIYISYFSAGGPDKRLTVKNALGFVLGFTLVFTAMGAFAGTLGGLLQRHQTAVNLVSGGVVILFGLSFLGIIRLPMPYGASGKSRLRGQMNPLTSLLFGMAFSVGWTPCVGAFLGSALMLASQQASAWKGVLMLLCYSLGLGIPFVFSAVLIDRLKSTFDWIKRHYRAINIAAGGFLIIMGVLMMTGALGSLLALLSI